MGSVTDPEQVVAFYKAKLAQARQEIVSLRKANRAYAREARKLWTRFYQDERTIQQLRRQRKAA